MTNNKQQTAVDLFIEELEEKGKAYEENQVVRTINICIDVSDYMELKQKAKAWHRNEVRDAFYIGRYEYNNFDSNSSQYYEQTYGGGDL